jgi:hypothetical protein
MAIAREQFAESKIRAPEIMEFIGRMRVEHERKFEGECRIGKAARYIR